MNQEPNQYSPQDPMSLQASVASLSSVASESVVPKKRNTLAVWTLIVNIANYGLPLLAAILYFSGIATGAIDLNDMGVGILLTLAIFAFLGFMSFVSVATLVLDILYLVKGKPKGKARVWVIISLAIYGLVTLAGVGLSVYLMLQQPY